MHHCRSHPASSVSELLQHSQSSLSFRGAPARPLTQAQGPDSEDERAQAQAEAQQAKAVYEAAQAGDWKRLRLLVAQKAPLDFQNQVRRRPPAADSARGRALLSCTASLVPRRGSLSISEADLSPRNRTASALSIGRAGKGMSSASAPSRRQGHSRTQGTTCANPLACACACAVTLIRHPSPIRATLEAHAPTLVSVPQCGWSALHCAALSGSEPCVRALFDAGAEPNAANKARPRCSAPADLCCELES
jgi:hypothetical protein